MKIEVAAEKQRCSERSRSNYRGGMQDCPSPAKVVIDGKPVCDGHLGRVLRRACGNMSEGVECSVEPAET